MAMIDKSIYSKGIYSEVGNAMPPATTFSSASSALEDARTLASRVSEIVDRLCGAMPEETSNVAKIGGYGSVLFSLRDESERTAEALRRAGTQLTRLERELP